MAVLLVVVPHARRPRCRHWPGCLGEYAARTRRLEPAEFVFVPSLGR
jgi:hypothetical protein